MDNFIVDFTIGNVFIQMNNLFNGENKLLADNVNKFLNDHSQDVIKEVRPEISKQLSTLVTRVMNDAFSDLPADKLINSLQSSSAQSPVVTHPLPPPVTHPLPPDSHVAAFIAECCRCRCIDCGYPTGMVVSGAPVSWQ